VPDKGLRLGQVGTVVEQVAWDACAVEFRDAQGRTYATLALDVDQLLVLHHELSKAA
jgi:hypothetical protein